MTVLASDAKPTKARVEAILAEPELIRPVFQPIVDLRRSTVCGFEMLARFGAGYAGSPLDWLQAAGRHGLASALDARDRLPPDTFLRSRRAARSSSP